jgi:hypothetical protein
MISSADYEAAATHTVELAGVKAGAEALADTTAAATAAAAAIAELVKQTKEPDQWTTRQMPASREMAGAPSPQQAGPKRDATGDAGQERENLPPPDRVIHAEKAAAKAGVKPDDQPAEGGSTEQPPAGPRQIIPSGRAAPEEQAENAARPELPGAGRDFQNRFDAARGRIGNHAQSAGELQALLDQAIRLLESVSQHPALRDAADMKRRLDTMEQRLDQTANTGH